MNEPDSHEELSDYYDDQLPAQRRADVARHVRQCDSCRAELATYTELSRIISASEPPMPPAAIWDNIERALKADQRPQRAQASRTHARHPLYRWAMIAACLLVATAVGGIGWITWQRARAAHHVVDLSGYLDLFEQNPDQAVKLLVAKYDGKPIALTTVNTDHVNTDRGTIARAVRQLPEDFSIHDAHVLKMPGCTCVHCTCHAADGETLAVLEHPKDQAVTFGKRPVIRTRCDGTTCKIVQVGDRLAVSWQQNGRGITVIGACNLEEVQQLIDRLNSKSHPPS